MYASLKGYEKTNFKYFILKAPYGVQYKIIRFYILQSEFPMRDIALGLIGDPSILSKGN